MAFPRRHHFGKQRNIGEESQLAKGNKVTHETKQQSHGQNEPFLQKWIILSKLDMDVARLAWLDPLWRSKFASPLFSSGELL
jgi:hypothetical protein